MFSCNSKVFCISTWWESVRSSLRLAKFLISFASNLHDNSKLFLIEFYNAVSVIFFGVFARYILEWKIIGYGKIIFNISSKANCMNYWQKLSCQFTSIQIFRELKLRIQGSSENWIFLSNFHAIPIHAKLSKKKNQKQPQILQMHLPRCCHRLRWCFNPSKSTPLCCNWINVCTKHLYNGWVQPDFQLWDFKETWWMENRSCRRKALISLKFDWIIQCGMDLNLQ